MIQAMSQDASANLGGLYFLIFIGIGALVVRWYFRTVVPWIIRRERDKKIEAAIRYDNYDREAYDRIARRIDRERD